MTAVLVFAVIIPVVSGAGLIALLAGRRANMLGHGVTREVREAARTAEPDETAPEPEEFLC